jgi:hypothetical protein
MGILTGSRSSFRACIQFLDEHHRRIEKYIERCDAAQPLQYLIREIAYMSAGRMRIIVYYSELVSRKRKGETSTPRTNNANSTTEVSDRDDSRLEPDTKTLRDQLFTIAITVLKRSDDVMKDPRLARWAWHSRTYIQWQSIALVLSEICTRPPSAQCDEAWKYATAVYNKWLSVKFRDSTERGDNFFKPIGLLLAKARHVRDMQQAQAQTQMSRSDAGEWMMPGQRIQYDTPGSRASLNLKGVDATSMNQGSRQTIQDSMTTTTAPTPDNPYNGPPIYGISDFDPFMEMLPDEVQNDWFDSMESMATEATGAHHSWHEMMSTPPFFSCP